MARWRRVFPTTTAITFIATVLGTVGIRPAVTAEPATATVAPPTLRLNGWHSCTMDIGDGRVPPQVGAECATVAMPLCHTNVCADPANRTIELFLKRIPGKTNASDTVQRDFWFVPDHPSTMSTKDAERQMLLLYEELKGQVSVYLMDQRGTGRGTLFNCEASQATSPVSAEGAVVAVSEVASCAVDLRSQFGVDFATPFSITSAARDLVAVISAFQAQSTVYLYGVGFGTHVVERAMHFPAKPIVGYVFDSTATTSGGKKREFAYRSQADRAFGDVGKAYLELCDDDANCSGRFGDKSATQVLTELLRTVDTTNKVSGGCETLLLPFTGNTTSTAAEPPSYALRRLLARMLQDLALRPFIPVVIYRLKRCEDGDRAVLASLFERVHAAAITADAKRSGAAMLLVDLIQFSELWETPTPDDKELASRFTKSLVSRGSASTELARYCAFTQDSSDTCKGANLPRVTDGTPALAYYRDRFWNAAAAIPTGASVLLLHSKYDGETPVEHAEVLADSLDGQAKALLVFESAAHNVLANTPLLTVEERALPTTTPSCARQILSSFVTANGDLPKTDTSCHKRLATATLNFTIPHELSQEVLNLTDAFDGVLPVRRTSADGSHGGDPSGAAATVADLNRERESEAAALRASRNRYRTAFIVFLLLALTALGAVLVLLYRARKQRLLREEEQQIRWLREEEEAAANDFEFLRELYVDSPTSWFNYRSNRMHM